MNNTMIGQQKGATLIVVLILLLIITIICIYAAKKSMSSLKIATSEQAQQLMFQSSEAYLMRLTNMDANTRLVSNTVNGLIGDTKQDSNIGSELAFCYDQSMNTLFDASRVGINHHISGGMLNNLNTTQPLTNGVCNNQFTSSRNAVMTQIYIKKSPANDSEPLSDLVLGTDHKSIPNPAKIRVHAISVIPALATNSANIQTCFSRFPAEKEQGTSENTVVECLQHFNIPYSSQVADFEDAIELNSQEGQ